MKKIKLFAIVVMACVSNVLPVMSKTYDAAGTNRLRVSTCVRVGDMWAEKWNNQDYKVATQFNATEEKFVVTLYSRDDEVWNYFCKITINDFTLPTKKIIKENQKNDKWFQYNNCDVEFFYNVEYPSVEESFANYGGFAVNSKNSAAKKRTVKGQVILCSTFFTAGGEKKDTNKMNMTINCFFDEVAYAISFIDLLLFNIK